MKMKFLKITTNLDLLPIIQLSIFFKDCKQLKTCKLCINVADTPPKLTSNSNFYAVRNYLDCLIPQFNKLYTT